jgi:hypothetical protein
MPDFRWISNGGSLLDGSGDIAFTSSAWEELSTMIATRLKADLDSWQLYRIGANLGTLPAQTVAPELESAAQQQALSSISDLVPAGMVQVKTLTQGSEIMLFVYINEQLVYTTTLAV